jgi:hypothetical protein
MLSYGSLMGSSVIVGSSWGKVLKHCRSWGHQVITPTFKNIDKSYVVTKS